MPTTGSVFTGSVTGSADPVPNVSETKLCSWWGDMGGGRIVLTRKYPGVPAAAAAAAACSAGMYGEASGLYLKGGGGQGWEEEGGCGERWGGGVKTPARWKRTTLRACVAFHT
jgi:hypothetical protein